MSPVFNRFSVNTNCEVNLCFHDWNDEYVIGRVEHKDSIQKIWQSAAYEEFRRKEINRTARKDDPLCKDCNIRPDAWNYTYELLLKKTGVLNWDKI
ncbi:MAG: SPASM domain-containing protein [Chitinophagaceae bacterium]|nr:SPASM domain-containing protein [Chitinophagaceae bacterium]